MRIQAPIEKKADGEIESVERNSSGNASSFLSRVGKSSAFVLKKMVEVVQMSGQVHDRAVPVGLRDLSRVQSPKSLYRRRLRNLSSRRETQPHIHVVRVGQIGVEMTD